MKKNIIILTILTTSSSSYGTPLSSGDWDDFFAIAKATCISTQSNIPINTNASIGEITAYCTCTARASANTISYEDLNYASITGDKTQIINVANNSSKKCGQ